MSKLTPGPLLALLLVGPTQLVAQRTPNEGCDKTTSYPCGALRRTDPILATSILDVLHRQPVSTWAGGVLEPFFGELYDDQYVDWVIFLDAGNNTVRQGLYRDGKLIRNDRLKGDENVWVVVFSTSKLKLPKVERDAREAARQADLTAAAEECLRSKLDCSMELTLKGENPAYVEDADDGALLRLKREVIQHAANPVLAAAFRALAGGLLGDAAKQEAIGDTTFSMKFDSVATVGSQTLFVGITRVRIPENAIVRLSARPGSDREIPGHLGVFRNLANGRRSPWVAGLSVAGTFNAQEPKFNDGVQNGHTEALRTSLMLYLGRTLRSDAPPQGGGSVSLVGGTNVVTGELFRDLFIGLSASTSSNLSLLAGLNYARLLERGRTDNKQVSQREKRLMVGLGLSIQ